MWTPTSGGRRSEEGVRAGLRRVALSLARREEAPVALACWWDALLAAGAAPRLLLALGADEAALLAAHVRARRGALPDDGADADARRTLLRWVRTTFPPTDARRQLAESLTRDAPAGPASPPPEDIAGTAGSATATRPPHAPSGTIKLTLLSEDRSDRIEITSDFEPTQHRDKKFIVQKSDLSDDLKKQLDDRLFVFYRSIFITKSGKSYTCCTFETTALKEIK